MYTCLFLFYLFINHLQMLYDSCIKYSMRIICLNHYARETIYIGSRNYFNFLESLVCVIIRRLMHCQLIL